MGECIFITCYGKQDVWHDRDAAKQFYLDCMANSEGAERERYINILFDLIAGKKECKDVS